MDRIYQITAILARLASVFLIIRTISYYPAMLSQHPEHAPDLKYIVFVSAMSLTFIGLALILWKFPLFIARGIVPEVQSGESLAEVPFDQIQAGLLSVFGVALVVLNCSDLAYSFAFQLALGAADHAHGHASDPGVQAAFYSAVLELALGLWLAFGSRGIVRCLNRLRQAGLSGK